MRVNRDVVDAHPWSHLLNGQRVELVKVSRQDLIAFKDVKLKTAEAETANRVDTEDPKAAEVMKAQIKESHIEAEEMNMLTAIFRAYGPDIYLLEEDDKRRGMDTRQIGNKVDLKKGAAFVIAASRGDEMRQLFLSPPSLSGLEIAGSFDIEERYNYLGDGYNEPTVIDNGDPPQAGENKFPTGFIVKYRHPDTGVLSEIRFLFAEDDKIRSLVVKRHETQSSREVVEARGDSSTEK